MPLINTDREFRVYAICTKTKAKVLLSECKANTCGYYETIERASDAFEKDKVICNFDSA